MKKIKRALCVLVVAACFVFVLTGCGAKIVSASIQPEATLAKGETLVLTPSYTAEQEASDEALAKAAEKLSPVWASDDEAVCTVDADGAIHAVDAGEATITLTAKEGVSAQCRVTVYVPLESLRAPEELTLALNAKETAVLEVALDPIEADSVQLTYMSDDETVATVDSDGLVRAVGAGECKIKTRAVSTTGAGEITKELETVVTVHRAPKKLSASDMTLAVGESAALEIDFGLAEGETADIGTSFTYTSSDEDIAVVDEDGTVTAKSVGETSITATNEFGQNCKVTVKVAEPVRQTASANGNGGPVGERTPDQGSGVSPSTPASTPEPAPAPSTPPAPDPTPTPTPPTPDEPQHYHGNGTDEGACPVCGLLYSPVIDPSTVPDTGDGGE